MKLFDVNWPSVLRDLDRWTPLTSDARRVLLDELKMAGYVQAARFGVHLSAIVASAIPQYDVARHRLWVGDDERELVKVLRVMGRHHLFTEPSRPALLKYMDEHYTNDDVTRVGARQPEGGYVRFVNRLSLAQRIASHGWAQDLIDAESDAALDQWAVVRGEAPGMRELKSLRVLQRLARECAKTPSGTPISTIVASNADVQELGRAIHIGLRTMVLFACLRHVDLEPLIGIWPEAAVELSRPPLQQPTPVTPVEDFSLALQMEDMTTLLAAIVAAPVRLRAQDRSIFARTQADIERRLVAPPEWTAPFFANRRLSRLDEAALELAIRGFVDERDASGNTHLHATAAGVTWLAMSAQQRLVHLVNTARNSKEANPPGAYRSAAVTNFFPFSLPYADPPKGLRLRAAIESAFLGATREFVHVGQFLDYHARENNPFLTLPAAGPGSLRMMYYGEGDIRDNSRQLWYNALNAFLTIRLIGLGGARVGRLDNGALCFKLTDVGRYLLGDSATQSFEYGMAEVADVVVQPNFEVVFLGTAPAVEAGIARFAQRVGVAPGLVFRITRASVLAAAEAGASAEDVLSALTRSSSKSVPKNVEREIRGWMSSVRRAVTRSVVLLECADDESASRVTELLGGKVRMLAPRIFEMPVQTAAARVAQMKKLRAGGVFLTDTTAAPAPPASRSRMRFENPVDDWEEHL